MWGCPVQKGEKILRTVEEKVFTTLMKAIPQGGQPLWYVRHGSSSSGFLNWTYEKDCSCACTIMKQTPPLPEVHVLPFSPILTLG